MYMNLIQPICLFGLPWTMIFIVIFCVSELPTGCSLSLVTDMLGTFRPSCDSHSFKDIHSQSAMPNQPEARIDFSMASKGG